MNRSDNFYFLIDNFGQQQNAIDFTTDDTVHQNIAPLKFLNDTILKSHINEGFTFIDNDSIFIDDNYLGQPNNPQIFKDHLLQPAITNPVPIKRNTPDWFTVSLILTIAFFTWLKVVNSKVIQQLFSALFSNSVTNQIVRDENVLMQRASVLFSLIFYFTGALFLYQVSVYYHWNYRLINSGFARFVIFVLFLATAYSFKMVFLKLLSIILNMDKAVSTYIFNIFLINNIVGIILIPVVILIAFSTGFTLYLIWLAIAILLVSFFYRLFRGFIIWTTMSRSSLYYLILYLCALEIAPLLILLKLA